MKLRQSYRDFKKLNGILKKIEMIIFWMMSFNFMIFIYSFVMVYLVILIIFTIIALDNVNVYNNRHSQCKIKSKKKSYTSMKS